jgi:Tol biopolymer transport system component
MEIKDQINETKSNDGSFKIPLIVFSVLGVCALGSLIIFCGVAFLFTRVKGNLPINILATPVPTVDIVKVTDDDPMWRLIINDGFDKNEHGWPVNAYQGDGVNLERKLENGKYKWEFKALGGWSFYGYPEDMDRHTDFVVSAEFTHTQGALFDGYGFIMRSTGNKYYFLRVSELGQYVFGYRTNDNDTLLLEGRTRQIRAGQPNQIAVKAKGTRFTIYVNNYQIAVVENDFITSGWVGLLLSPTGIPVNEPGSDAQDTAFSVQSGSPSRFEVDNFKFWIPAVNDNAANRTPSPSLQPKGGRLVFVSSRDGNREIYSLDTNGRAITRLTKDPAEDYAPKWSPDGKQIVFVSTREGNPDIFVMDRDGSNIIKLTDDPADDVDPSWSPDGQKIVFASNRSGNYNLYILDRNTRSVERLTEEDSDDRYPDWSPRDNVILFQSNRKSSADIFSVSVKTLLVTQITKHNATYSAHPAWSPVGLSYAYETILYEGRSGIATSDFPSGHFQTVVDMSNSSLWPAWSSDGSQIAFVSNRDGQTDIYIVNKEGTAIYRLTDDPAVESELDWTAE